MSDKPLVQQALAQELAELVLAVAGAAPSQETPSADKGSTLHALTALDFYEVFWATMQAEWLGLDKHRCAATDARH